MTCVVIIKGAYWLIKKSAKELFKRNKYCVIISTVWLYTPSSRSTWFLPYKVLSYLQQLMKGIRHISNGNGLRIENKYDLWKILHIIEKFQKV